MKLARLVRIAAIALLIFPSCSFAQSAEVRDTVFACQNDDREPSAWYVGPYEGYDSNLSGADIARDMLCASAFKDLYYPRGFVTVFGSSRIKEYLPPQKPSGEFISLSETAQAKEFNQTYAYIKTFSYLWSKSYKNQYPILTGAGPGIMEAASRGAHEAGLSIGYTTYYGPPAPGSSNGQTDVPSFHKYNKNEVITDSGLIFSSVSARETSMIIHSAAAVFAPGGSGTEWEIFQTLEMIKSKQLGGIPLFFVGEMSHWQSLLNRLEDMKRRGVISEGEISINFAECPEDLKNQIALNLKLVSEIPDSSIACKKRSTYEIESLKELRLLQ
ncbi:MAG: hypothetical protein HOQ32_01140 [Lysobacter sp.]|nr:hypothetical protein [Lysobacter sp.]